MAKKKRKRLTKTQVREKTLRKKRQQQMTWALVAVVAVAAVVVVILIAMSGEDSAPAEVHLLRDDIETGLTELGYPYRGSADAAVTVIEFSDYNCSHCRDFALESAPLIDDEFVASGQIRYVVQPFALWEGSLSIVEAAACARDQDGFWNYHHRAMVDQHRFSPQQPPSRVMLREWAEADGLDIDEFQACLDEDRHWEEVQASTRNGREVWGVDGTPAFFFNGNRVQLLQNEAPVDTFRKAIQAASSGG